MSIFYVKNLLDSRRFFTFVLKMSKNKQHIFLLDNYDSFTYNLVHYVESFGHKVTVKRNDNFLFEELKEIDKIILSPGPGLPKNAGLMNKLIDKYYKSKPILGVCLGHQALGEFFGAELYNLKEVFHGVSSIINVENSHPLFHGMETKQEVGRYHSWAIKNGPNDLIEIGVTTDGNTNMAFCHSQFPCVGIQFHPESVLTPNGKKIIKNWLDSY